MATEIEYKFLVAGDGWRAAADAGRRLSQGYLASGGRVSVRVRIAGDDDAWLNVKYARGSLVVRNEFEYAIPVADAREIFADACDLGRVEKTRYLVEHAGHTWEVDVFHGDNEGLVVAEIELEREDEPFERPAWLGDDVSQERRYLNQCLAREPYRSWRDDASSA